MGRERVKRERRRKSRDNTNSTGKYLEERERGKTGQKIGESKYNRYTEIMENLPKYLQGKRRRKDGCLMARYRCGNEPKGN